jgi:hypothetical protein
MIVTQTRIPGTTRQRVTLATGVELERQYTYMTTATWANLKMLATIDGIAGSQVIANLINHAAKAVVANSQ